MKKIETKNAPGAIGPYSQGFVINGFVFTSGQSRDRRDAGRDRSTDRAVLQKRAGNPGGGRLRCRESH